MSESLVLAHLGWGRWFWRYENYDKAVYSIGGTRDDAVGSQFDRIEGASFGTDFSGLDGLIYPDGDSCAFFVRLVGFEFTYDLGLGELFAAVGGNIPVPYNMEVTVAFDTI